MEFKTHNRKQLTLFGYCLDDFVSPDDKCRIIVDIINHLNLNDFYEEYASRGAPALDPAVMLAVWFFAYAEGITTSSRIEELCRRDMKYIYLSANLKPNRGSLNRFRKRHIDILPEYFRKIIEIAENRSVHDFSRIKVNELLLLEHIVKDGTNDDGNLLHNFADLKYRIKKHLTLLGVNLNDPLPQNEKTLSADLKKIKKLKKMLSKAESRLNKKLKSQTDE